MSSTLLYVVFLPEPLNPSRRIHQLLFAGEEGVAGRANFHLDVFDRGTGLDHIAAGAGNFGHFIPGMNLLFHVQILQIICPTPAPPGAEKPV
jgi:hypothetical protein